MCGDGSNSLNERNVCYSRLATNQPLLLGQDTLQHAQDALYLIAVALLCAQDLLAVASNEPRCLSVVWALPRRLEEQPLQLLILLRSIGDGDLMLWIVTFHEVKHNRTRFPVFGLTYNPHRRRSLNHSPKDKIVVLVIDDRRNASVRVVLDMFRLLLFSLPKVQVYRLVRQP